MHNMRSKEEKTAQELNEALSHNKEADVKYQPYLRMAKALEQDAKENGEMDKSVMEEQKMHLMKMAKNIKQENMQKESKSSSNSEQKTAKKEKGAGLFKRPWYIWAGGLAVAAAVVVVVFVTNTAGPLPFLPQADEQESFMGKAKLSVIIPAAHAGDAFNVLVEKGDSEDAAVDTSFKVESKVDVDTEDLRQSLRIVNAAREQDGVYVDFDIKKEGDKNFVITPATDLDPGEVYKVSIAAAVDGENEKKPREFSWAIQTRDKFRILRSVPGHQSSYVPVNTSIEVTMSKTGWEDPEEYFDIKPAVSGRFETHGRTLVFVPEEPLKRATIYTVTYKRGWGISEDLQLEEDVVLKFETAAEKEYSRNRSYFSIYKYLFESSLDKDVVIPVRTSDDLKSADISVTGYKVSLEQAYAAVQELEEIPHWARQSKERATTLQDLAEVEAFTLQAKLEESGSNWMDYLRLPADTPKGWYVVKVSPADDEFAQWILLQRTDVAAYTMVTRDKLVVWAVNKDTSMPLSNMVVAFDGQTGTTDNRGLAEMQTPDDWRAYLDEQGMTWKRHDTPHEVLKLGDENMGLLLNVQYIDWYWGYAAHDPELNYWSYLYPDRPLYSLTDTMNVFGFLQDRETGEGAGTVQVELRSNSMDYSTFKTKVVARAELVTDAGGFFEGELSWSVPLTPGYYNVVLTKDGKEMDRRYIEVRDIMKPAYTVKVLPQDEAIYAGDVVRGQIKTEFFDGTPYGRLDLEVETYGAGGGEETLVTDDNGVAKFEYDTEPPICTATKERVDCPNTQTFTIEAYPTLGEEAEIFGQASVRVWRGKHHFESYMDDENGERVVKFKVREVDLRQATGENSSVLGEGVSDAAIDSEIYEVYWDRIEDGTRYDPIEKKVYPTYRYERRFERVGEFKSRTDASGEATLSFPMEDDISYRVISTYREGDKVMHADMAYIYSGATYYNPYYSNHSNENITFKSGRADNDDNEYELGEKVELRLMRDNEMFQEDGARYLYVRASRGIRSITASENPYYNFDYSEEDVPNVAVYGIVYTPDGFTQTQYHAEIDTNARKLNVDLSTDKNQYAPGAQIKVRAKVTDQDGKAVRGARVVVSVVDEALLAIATRSSDPSVMYHLYEWVPSGILASNWSHQYEETGPGGGAEMGGGEGLGSIRKDFRNTAAFLVMETGFGGDAEKTFTAPDNITSWRFTAAAITEDHYAGQSRINVPVTKSLFVDAVIPNSLTVSDKPTLKIRAHGTALPSQGKITYVVDIPSLGIDEQEVQGEVYEPVYLAVDKLMAGEHKAIIGVKAGGKVDAIERTIEVVQSRATKEERVVTELGPGTALPDPGVSSKVLVTFESKAKALKRADVYRLAQPWSARLEAQLAGVMMRDLYKEYYGDDIEEQVDSLLAYQQADGGISILPYASSGAELSAKAAAAKARAFDTAKLTNYFWELSDDEEVAREEVINAVSGLASLGEPVLERLKSAAKLEDLSWREQLALMRGMEAAGDREAAKGILDALLAKAEIENEQMRLNVSEDVTEEIEATVQAASMAAVLAHPDAEKLMAYVEAVWNHEAMTDLERAVYLEKIVPTLSDVDVKIGYAIGEETGEVDLSEWAYHTITLLPQEVKQFRVTSVNGPAAASFARRVEGDIGESSPLINITRTYSEELNELGEGDNVRVNLQLSWDARAQDGCYIVRDRLPGTMMPIVSVKYARWHRLGNWYPFQVDKGEVSFMVCKRSEPVNINYTARVVALGEYSAEGAIVQSMQVPGLAAKTEPVTVKVK
ncbi:hypothetical protein GF391_04400 [Candidatus Uhrbacteria bacterium]|nr:hypothetical protein [Candidatus Uhrbacteria bacterium]